MNQLVKMAIRDLGRNRRRSFFSSLALGLGLALMITMAAVIKGEMSGAMDTTIRLQSGHLQIRAKSYEESKTSLKWEDLVENPVEIADQIASLDPVLAASPRLFASGIVSVRDKSTGVRIFGIDPLSEVNAPYRIGLIEGSFVNADDREGVLIGQPLAEKLGVKVGEQINLSINTSDGDVNEQVFIIRGIYSTRTNAFDSLTVFLPIAKAQTITKTENHASTIFVLLKDKNQTDAVISALQSSRYEVLDWINMNDLIIKTEEMANSYMNLFYLIVLGITATVIVNTLIMSVFERTREIGILSAIGMKSRSIMAMFLAETSLLAIGGIVMGVILGLFAVGYLAKVGIYVGNMGLTMLFGNYIYPELTFADALKTTIFAFIITLLAGIYPAVIASRMEPVQAMRGGK
ncbi:MAG: ABC transporter permease [Chloroflexi bacterium]|nr:ABC transporter permease [Chloroflexota bacterium]